MIIYWNGLVDRHAQMMLSDSVIGVWWGGPASAAGPVVPATADYIVRVPADDLTVEIPLA
jgi:hypothetical protein